MDLYFDLDIAAFVTTPGARERLTALEFKRGDTCILDVRFFRGGSVVSLSSAASGKFGLKPVGNYDGAYSAAATSWVKSGTGETTVYRFNINLNTSGINTLLGVGAGTDVASVVLNGEMEFVEGSIVTSSPTIAVTVHNDVNRGSEVGPPTVGSGVPVNSSTKLVKFTTFNQPSNGETFVFSDPSGIRDPLEYVFKTTAIPNQYPIHVQIGTNFSGTMDNLQQAVDDNDWANSYFEDSELYFLARNPGDQGNFTLSGTAFGPSKLVVATIQESVESTPGGLGSIQVTSTHLYVVCELDEIGQRIWKKISLTAL